jgi:hypothetical protein
VVLVVEDWSSKTGWGSDDDLGVACCTPTDLVTLGPPHRLVLLKQLDFSPSVD